MSVIFLSLDLSPLLLALVVLPVLSERFFAFSFVNSRCAVSNCDTIPSLSAVKCTVYSTTASYFFLNVCNSVKIASEFVAEIGVFELASSPAGRSPEVAVERRLRTFSTFSETLGCVVEPVVVGCVRRAFASVLLLVASE